jgi:Zn-dependent protease with chaperone function
MNFFEQQDIARRNARLLLWSFLAAVLLLILLTNAAVAAFMWLSGDYSVYTGGGGVDGFLSYFSWQRFGLIGLGMGATVAMVALAKTWQLSRGGKTVAEAMGGRRVLSQTDDPAERRCLNVVEELALAATMPVPPVYVLENERGINAFAAGLTPADAVVAVTRGTLEQLRRHELEGVIAHEFSHILNGDMRLNIRLASLLKGITFMSDIGYLLMHSSRRAGGSSRQGDAAALLPLLGLAVWLLGLFGSLAAGFIKAALGRQKEYLADASAVQYTRNPDTIGDALKVIGGYVPGTLVQAARAEEMSHIFFGQIRHRLWETFATHPPLDQRIRRVDPHWNGQYIKRRVSQYRDDPGLGPGVGRASIALAALGAMAAQPAIEPVGLGDNTEAPTTSTGSSHHLPPVLVHNSHEPLGASAVVCCLLLHPGADTRRRQLELAANAGIPGLGDLVTELEPEVRLLTPPQRLPLLELCLPALKSVSPEQYRRFKETVLLLIRADAHTELHEWCLFQLLRHYLDPEFMAVRPSRPRYDSLQKVAFHVRMVLSVLAWEGSGEARAVFRLGANALGFNALEILPREQCSVAAFSNGVRQLADCYPLLKPPLLQAMAVAAGSDGRLNAAEREIIASMAAVMDCPVPLLPAVDPRETD